MKIAIIVLIICCCILSACSSYSPNKYISNQLGIDIPGDIMIKLTDTHGGFHGDGTTYTKIEFTDKNAETISTTIKENGNWNSLPLSENLQLMLYGGTREEFIYQYNLAIEFGIPTIQHGYWVFIDRIDSEITLYNDDEELFDRASFNFTVAIYDIDKDTMYYLEYDT